MFGAHSWLQELLAVGSLICKRVYLYGSLRACAASNHCSHAFSLQCSQRRVLNLHERELPAGFGSLDGELEPGNSFLTLATSDLEGLTERAGAARAVRSDPRPLSVAPYRGRRAVMLEGPAGERVEVMELGE